MNKQAEYMRKYRKTAKGRATDLRGYARTKEYHKTKEGAAALRAGYVNRTAKNRGMQGKLSKDDILALGECCGHPCCDAPWEEIDHILCCALGGENSGGNIIGLCKIHHRDKTNAELGYLRRGEPLPQWVKDLVPPLPASSHHTQLQLL